MVFLLDEAQPESDARGIHEGAKAINAAVANIRALVQEACSLQVPDALRRCSSQADVIAAAAALGYAVHVREGQGGGRGAACLQQLRHQFVVLTPPPRPGADDDAAGASGSDDDEDDGGSSSGSSTDGGATQRRRRRAELIVDSTFREQFSLGHPSPRYEAVIRELPARFVGSLAGLRPLVEALSAEMALCLQAAGIALPPWRSYRSLMSKWAPRRSQDFVLHCPPGAGQPPAGSANAAPAAAALLPPLPAATGARCAPTQHAAPAVAAAATATMLLRAAGGLGSLAGSTGSGSAASSSMWACSWSSSSPGPVVRAAQAAAPRVAAQQQLPAHSKTWQGACRAPPAGPRCHFGAAPTQGAAPQAVPNTSRGGPPAAAMAVLPRVAAPCAEPLQRVVGGFGVL